MKAFGLAMLMVGMLVAGTAWAQAPAGYYQDQKVVYQNTGGMPDNMTYFKGLLRNLRNHVAAVGKDHVKLDVVNIGAGVDLFIAANHDADLAAQVDALRADGVRFLMCGNTLRGRHIDWHTLYKVQEGDVVPSGMAELARLQGMGFAYIHP